MHSRRSDVFGKGYIWGRPVDPLLDLLRAPNPRRGFDLIIMSDLIFNHSQVGPSIARALALHFTANSTMRCWTLVNQFLRVPPTVYKPRRLDYLHL